MGVVVCYLELSEVDKEGDDEAEGGWVWLWAEPLSGLFQYSSHCISCRREMVRSKANTSSSPVKILAGPSPL